PASQRPKAKRPDQARALHQNKLAGPRLFPLLHRLLSRLLGFFHSRCSPSIVRRSVLFWERSACNVPSSPLASVYGCARRVSSGIPWKMERRRLFGGFAGERSLVVALAGKDGQTLAAHTNLQGMVVVLALAVGLKGQSVLVAGLLGDAGIEILEGLARGAKKHFAAGIVGIFFEAAEFPLKVSAAHSHTVDRDPLAQQLGARFVIFVGIKLGAIFPVRNKKDNLPVLLPRTVLKQHSRGVNGVVQSLGGLPLNRD